MVIDRSMARRRRRGEDEPDPPTVRLLAGRYRTSGTSSSRRNGKLVGLLDQYLEDISRYPLIDREEEGVLARKAREGDSESLDRLVRANLRFVVSVAKKYQNRGVPLADLINEGNVGLIRAAHKFDENRGTRFISYAVWWIRQGILQALADQGRIVRVPLNRAGTVHRITRRSASLLQELGREPTTDELARGLDLTLEEVSTSLRVARPHLSLDAPLTPGEDSRMLDYLADARAAAPEEDAFAAELKRTVDRVLSSLKEREAKVVRLYFGLDDQEPMTLDEIGVHLGVTRERVRQIKEQALRRLRHESRSRQLRSFGT